MESNAQFLCVNNAAFVFVMVFDRNTVFTEFLFVVPRVGGTAVVVMMKMMMMVVSLEREKKKKKTNKKTNKESFVVD